MTDTQKPDDEKQDLEQRMKHYGDTILDWTSPDRWLPKRKKPAEDQIVYGTLNDRMFASALDMGLILLLFYRVFFWIDGRIDPAGSTHAMQSAAMQGASFSRVFEMSQNTHMIDVLIQNYLIQCSIIGIVLVGFWSYGATSPGKWLLRLRIVDEATGIPVKAGQAALRYVSYYASSLAGAAAFMFLTPSLGAGIAMLVGAAVAIMGFLWTGLDAKKQGLHDKLAGTAVIKVKHWRFKRTDASEYPAPILEEEEAELTDEDGEETADAAAEAKSADETKAENDTKDA